MRAGDRGARRHLHPRDRDRRAGARGSTRSSEHRGHAQGVTKSGRQPRHETAAHCDGTRVRVSRRYSPRPVPDEQHPADAAGARGDITVQEPSRVQQSLARRVAESRATVPAFSLQGEVDMGACLRGLSARDSRPTVRDALVKACALALREHPRANARWRDGRFELLSRVNVGFAVPAHDTLFFPTILDADAKSLDEIAAESASLTEQVGARTITQPQLAGATFTVTVLDGADAVEPVIQPPQAGGHRRRRRARAGACTRWPGRRGPCHHAHAGVRPPGSLRRPRRLVLRARARPAGRTGFALGLSAGTVL